MSPADRVRLQHMRDAIAAAQRFARGHQRADLDRDEQLVFALVRAVEIVGEAAARVSSETRAQLGDVPWQAITGMRNRLVHAYFDINLDILWRTVTRSLPTLLEQLQAIDRDSETSE